MAEPTIAELSPEEWKQLALLNCAQLQTFLNNIPPHVESGASGLTAQHMGLVQEHTARGRIFLTAWANSKLRVPPQPAQTVAANGAVPGKRKRGRPAKTKDVVQAQ